MKVLNVFTKSYDFNYVFKMFQIFKKVHKLKVVKQKEQSIFTASFKHEILKSEIYI